MNTRTNIPHSAGFSVPPDTDDTRALARAVGPGEHLRPVHVAVLDLLRSELVVGTRQVERLLFVDGTPAARARRARRVLRDLEGWGLLDVRRPAPGGIGGGSRPAVWALAPRGEAVLAADRGERPRRIVRLRDRGVGRLLHHLELVELRVLLTEAAQAAGVSLDWRSEPACWEEVVLGASRERLKPDAFVSLETECGCVGAWIELDRGTQSVPVTLRAKALRYCRAARARTGDGRDVPFAVFVVGGSSRRARLVARLPVWAAEEGFSAGTAERFFRVLDAPSTVDWLVREARS